MDCSSSSTRYQKDVRFKGLLTTRFTIRKISAKKIEPAKSIPTELNALVSKFNPEIW